MFSHADSIAIVGRGRHPRGRHGLDLWGHLTQQVQHVHAQLTQHAHPTGVTAFLKMGMRAGQSMATLFPTDTSAMALNLQRFKFMVDCVLSYPFVDVATQCAQTKTAVQASTAKHYMQEVSLYCDELAGHEHKLHLGPVHVVRSFATHLLKCLPGHNYQKTGLTAATVRDVVAALRAVHGQGSVQEAAMMVSWMALLRPGECVVASVLDCRYGTR